MKELKNCPNCGGTLDDAGRCMYCKSKVYDFTDVKIDLNNREPIFLQLMSNGEPLTVKCYMCNPTITVYGDIDYYRDARGKLHRSPSFRHKVELTFIEY